jgi:hypothetical protein
MAVYVDDLRAAPRSVRWPYDRACHLVADSAEELHVFAARLGLRRQWAQKSRRGLLHYDLTSGMQIKARRMGAVHVRGCKAASELFSRLLKADGRD